MDVIGKQPKVLLHSIIYRMIHTGLALYLRGFGSY